MYNPPTSKTGRKAVLPKTAYASQGETYLSELVQRLQAGRLAHVAMQLGGRRQTSQAKQDLGSVGALLGPEEDNGLAALEGAAAQREQHSLLVPYAAALQAETNMFRAR